MRPLVLCLLLATVLLPVALAQTCNLVYCTRFGQRAECDFQSQLFPCALWHSLETRVNPDLCDSNCPEQCAPEDQRPIASDGNVYCTECALRFASCESRFVVFGPVNFGSPSDLPRAPVDVGVTPSPAASPSSTPPMEQTLTITSPQVISLPLQDNMTVGPVQLDMPMNDTIEMPREELGDILIDESPMPTSPEDDLTASPEQTTLSCEGDLNVFETIQCCNELDIGCIQAGQNCSTSGSLFPPVPCARGLECVIFDPGFPAADRPNRGICEASNTPAASSEVEEGDSMESETEEPETEEPEAEEPEAEEPETEEPDTEAPDMEEPETSAVPLPANELQQGAFCSTLGSLFPTASCAPGLFCDIFDPGFPAADVPNRGICRRVGSIPLTAPDDTPTQSVPPDCEGVLGNFARRQCCLESSVRCLRRGQLCFTAGSRIPPVPCAPGLVCRIFEPGFPAVDIPNRGVCLAA